MCHSGLGGNEPQPYCLVMDSKCMFSPSLCPCCHNACLKSIHYSAEKIHLVVSNLRVDALNANKELRSRVEELEKLTS